MLDVKQGRFGSLRRPPSEPHDPRKDADAQPRQQQPDPVPQDQTGHDFDDEDEDEDDPTDSRDRFLLDEMMRAE